MAAYGGCVSDVQRPSLPGPPGRPASGPRSRRRPAAQLVTEARPSLSDDIAYRQKRYLIMMGIRVLCFVAAVLLFVNHAGWVTGIPVVGAIAIPYFAVVFANGGREPSGTQGFRPYEPRLPARYVPPGQGGGAATPRGADPRTPGGNGAPPHNA
jgi:Protein of unknown function (DUF3099)